MDSWLMRESLVRTEKECARLEEEYDGLLSDYLSLEKEYDKAVDTVCFLYAELHSVLPHLAERLAAENTTLGGMVE